MRALAIVIERPYTLSDDVPSGIAPLRSLVAEARLRLAEIEANYIRDRCAIAATQAKLFNLVKQHYQERDRLRLIVRDRRKYLGVLLAGGGHEAVHVAGEGQRGTETASNDERTVSSIGNRKKPGDEAERELRKLWKQLILLYHPDRHADETGAIDTYVKLVSRINRAKEERDISRLREIANDPDGFVLRQGWTWLNFSDADEIVSLRKLLGTLTRIIQPAARRGEKVQFERDVAV